MSCVQGNAIRFLSFSYFALEAIVLSVFNNLPQHASDDAYNTIASKFGWGGCMNEGCTSSDKFKLASQLPAQKYGHAYMLPVAGLFVQGLLLPGVQRRRRGRRRPGELGLGL